MLVTDRSHIESDIGCFGRRFVSFCFVLTASNVLHTFRLVNNYS